MLHSHYIPVIYTKIITKAEGKALPELVWNLKMETGKSVFWMFSDRKNVFFMLVNL